MPQQTGLLSSFSPSEPPPQAAQGGLLGPMAAQAAAQPQGGGEGLQMAMQLSQNPTMPVAQQIVAKLHQMGNPEADQFDQMIQQTGGDPAMLKQLADAIVQKLGGAQ